MSSAASQRFQQSLLPDGDATFGPLETAAHYEPCAELCGDFYDLAAFGSGAALLVTDVVGHGAPAAMLTGMIKLAFHGAGADGYAPDVVMQRIFDSSRHFPFDKHISGFCARIHQTTRTLEYVSAGHPPAYLLRSAGGLERLDASGTLIHPALADWHCEQRVVPIGVGDFLVVYTDGLTEAPQAETEELFGCERLERLLERAPRGGAGALKRELREELRRFQAGRPLEDDLTIVVARVIR